MVGSDTEFRSAQKSRVAVMIGLVNLMDERGTLLSAGRLRAVAGGAVGVELGLARLEFRGNRFAADSGLRLRRVTGGHCGKGDRECQRGQ